jgi:hypothetical protein
VFGRRRKKEEEAAREAERHALFEELAKRPDTVCPFLGMAQARTEFHDGVSDSHRCYAFGDPAELSPEQQTKVCLQRGYGNCPRYLRGVLVIPTEELEALRRPQPMAPATPRPAPQPPAARPAVAQAGGGARRALIVVGFALLLAAGGGAAVWYLGNQVDSSAVAGTLKGGTTLEAELVSLSAPAGEAQMLNATAAIGETVAVPSTTLIYVFDLSASTLRGDACGRDQNGDDRADTPLDCEIAAATALNAQAIASGTVGEVGLVGFASGATIADLAPETGSQPLIGPDVDDDSDGTPNVVEAMKSAFSAARGEPVGFGTYSLGTTGNTTTSFSAGIAAACDALAGAETTNRLVVFLSDGSNRGGERVSSVLPCDDAAVFQTFAAGADASCQQVSELGGLQAIADLTGGTCTTVTDLTQLPAILEAVVEPQLTRIELTIDDGEPIDISESASSTLPQAGPASIAINASVPALSEGDHRLCLIVHASDAGGSGSVSSCSPVGSGGGRLTSSD